MGIFKDFLRQLFDCDNKNGRIIHLDKYPEFLSGCYHKDYVLKIGM